MADASPLFYKPQRILTLLSMAALATGCAQVARPGGEASQASTPAAEDTQVTLERTPCFGACPTFTLQVGSDGQATLSLPSKRAAKVAANGESEPVLINGRIPVAQVRQLLQTLHDGDFAALDDDYRANISDMPGTTLSMRTPAGIESTRVYGVPCASQARTDGMDPAMGSVKPVPDVFCKAAQQLDAMACTVYGAGQHQQPDGVEARFPPRCGTDA